MTIVHFVLDLYFAAVLVVSGFAKVENPADFAATMRRQRILPRWSLRSTSLVFPWLEIALAVTLIVGLIPVLTASFLCVLFTVFFGIQTRLLLGGRATDCGCFGQALQRRVDGASLLTSGALIVLTALHLWATLHGAALNWTWRLPSMILLCAVGGWMWWGAIRRRRYAAAFVMPSPREATSANSSQIVLDYTQETTPSSSRFSIELAP